MTTASSTFSDADYETSSELLSPRKTVPEENNDSQISRCSSLDLRFLGNESFTIAESQSSSALLVVSGRESATSAPTTSRHIKIIKSDTCLSQHGKDISDFMNDIFKKQEQEEQQKEQLIFEPNMTLTNKDSVKSIDSEFFPAVNEPVDTSGEESVAELDDSESFDSINKNVSENASNTLMVEKSESPHTSSLRSVGENISKRSEEKNACTTLSQTKNKIIENLAQVTYGKLFSRAGIGCYPPINRTETFIDKSQGEPLARAKTPSQSSQISRRSLRRNGVESILRIEYELQPLNLRLSKLLAEFRAMNLRGKLVFNVPGEFNSSFTELDDKCFESCDDWYSSKSNAIADREAESADQKFQAIVNAKNNNEERNKFS